MERPRVLVVGDAHLADAVCGLEGVTAERESDYGRALDLLVSGPHDVGVIGSELGGGVSGLDLVREAVGRNSGVPLIMAASSPAPGAEKAALEAGAVGIVDVSRPTELAWSVAFAHATRTRADERYARLLKEVSSFLAHEGKNVLAAIGGAVEVLSHGMPPGSADRAICQEIRERLAAFRDTIDAMTLAVRMRAPMRDTYPRTPHPPEGARPRKGPKRARSEP